MRKIFVINGLPRSGKTTFGILVEEVLKSHGIDFIHTSSIDPVKNLLRHEDLWWEEFQAPDFKDSLLKLKREITDQNWDGETKDAYWRKAMSDLKLSLLEHYPDFLDAWVLGKSVKLGENSVTFVDIREPESIDRFKDYCNLSVYETQVKAVLIKSNSGENFQNKSDESVFNYKYDYVVTNDREMEGKFVPDTLKSLRENVTKFVESEILTPGKKLEMR